MSMGKHVKRTSKPEMPKNDMNSRPFQSVMSDEPISDCFEGDSFHMKSLPVEDDKQLQSIVNANIKRMNKDGDQKMTAQQMSIQQKSVQ